MGSYNNKFFVYTPEMPFQNIEKLGLLDFMGVISEKCHTPCHHLPQSSYVLPVSPDKLPFLLSVALVVKGRRLTFM